MNQNSQSVVFSDVLVYVSGDGVCVPLCVHLHICTCVSLCACVFACACVLMCVCDCQTLKSVWPWMNRAWTKDWVKASAFWEDIFQFIGPLEIRTNPVEDERRNQKPEAKPLVLCSKETSGLAGKELTLHLVKSMAGMETSVLTTLGPPS